MDLTKKRLLHLKNKGFQPKFILDIGACVGEWTREIKTIFNNSHFYLLEANKDNEKFLIQSGENYKISLLGNIEKENVPFYKIKNGKYNTGDSMFLEQTSNYNNENIIIEKLKMTTLDNVLNNYWIKQPDFIKLDVQGAELLVLDGAKNSLKNCEFILLETQTLEYNKNAPKIFQVIKYMDAIGYEIYDFLDNHYLPDGSLMQVDLLFCKRESNFIKTGILC